MSTNHKSQRRAKGQGSLKQRSGSKTWTAIYTNANGKRVEKSTRTTAKAKANRILAKWAEDENQIRAGLIDPARAQVMHSASKPVIDLIDDYIKHSGRRGESIQHIAQKKSHLVKWSKSCGARVLQDLTKESVEDFLDRCAIDGNGNRTWNVKRQNIAAFMNWCAENGHIQSNPMKLVPKKDESQDQRHARRALTDSELSQLLTVANAVGREAWYATAAFTGMRKGEMKSLEWRDIDFENWVITLRQTKAKKVQQVVIPEELRPILLAHRSTVNDTAGSKVWTTTVTDRTRKRDFERAGIAHRDSSGRVADLHCLRTTLGTRLARNGVSPQIAQKVMRHSDINITIGHYTDLGIPDCHQALAKLPQVTVQNVVTAATESCPINRPPITRKLPGSSGTRRMSIASRRCRNPSKQSGQRDSNPRHSAWEADALPTNPSESDTNVAVSEDVPPSAPLSSHPNALLAAWEALSPEAKMTLMTLLAQTLTQFGAKILPSANTEPPALDK
jgi:integrase